MNRRERKAMEKRLGLDKYKKGLPRAERFEMTRQNILEGKKLESQMKEVRRVQENQTNDNAASARIASIATDLIVNKGMSWVEAQDKAKEIYKQEVETAVGHKE